MTWSPDATYRCGIHPDEAGERPQRPKAGGHRPRISGRVDTRLITSSYAVAGLECARCVSLLTEEVSLLPGVSMVVVDLVVAGESRMSVTGSEVLSPNTVGVAVAEAGFELVGLVS